MTVVVNSWRRFAVLGIAAGLLLSNADTLLAAKPRVHELVEKARKRKPPQKAAPAEAAPAPAVERVEELYKVNAQYRGAVKKGFDDLGEVTVVYKPQPNGQFGIELEADIRHPKKKGNHHFKAVMAFKLNGTVVEAVSQDSNFSKDAEKHREKILQNAPFIYLMRYFPFPESGSREVTFTISGKPFRVLYTQTGKHTEATVHEGNRWIGKFFILKGVEKPPYAYEKFRINTKSDTVISFVCDRAKKG